MIIIISSKDLEGWQINWYPQRIEKTEKTRIIIIESLTSKMLENQTTRFPNSHGTNHIAMQARHTIYYTYSERIIFYYMKIHMVKLLLKILHISFFNNIVYLLHVYKYLMRGEITYFCAAGPFERPENIEHSQVVTFWVYELEVSILTFLYLQFKGENNIPRLTQLLQRRSFIVQVPVWVSGRRLRCLLQAITPLQQRYWHFEMKIHSVLSYSVKKKLWNTNSSKS